MNIILPIQKNKTGIVQFCISKTAMQRLLIFMIAGFISLQSNSQDDQRIAMADKHFDAGEYFTAADLYEQYLHPVKKEIPKANFPLNSRRYSQGGNNGSINKLDVLYKQAESYRLANYWPEAAARYKDCFEKDGAKYADALYWYAVCKRSLGEYATAEESINNFLRNNFIGNTYWQEAEKELQTIQFIKKQVTRPDTGLYQIKKTNTSFGTEKGMFAPTRINGNQFLFTSTETDSAVIAGVNPFHSRLFYATLENGSLKGIKPITIQGTDASLNQGAACISANRNFLYFTQWKKENGKNISSIYYATRQDNGWGNPVLLSSINTNGYSSKQPFCSADGKKLFFASDIPGGSGGFDIWYATIQTDGTTGTPVNAGTVNTTGDEQAPFYHGTSSNLVFASNGMQGMGGYDLFSAKMKELVFENPENMGYPVNSSRDDIYFYALEEKELLNNAFFSSDRGSSCCLETYTVIKSPKKKMISGIVRDCKHNEPVADAEVVMKDITGKTLKTTSGPDGKFSFELAGDVKKQIFNVSKEYYNEKTEGTVFEYLNDSDWRIDIYNNIPLCIEKIEIVEKKLVIKAENVVTLYFDFDKSIVRTREIEILDSIYSVLAENNGATIQISGYTDGLGTDEYNRKLSDRRAKACADYLKKKGVESARISFVSFGECCPVEMELINGRDNPDGRSKNRRALINISKEE